jgi:hypothetical protein
LIDLAKIPCVWLAILKKKKEKKRGGKGSAAPIKNETTEVD